MDKIVQEKTISSRVRFKLQDVIDLRKVESKLIFPEFVVFVAELLISQN